MIGCGGEYSGAGERKRHVAGENYISKASEFAFVTEYYKKHEPEID
jgi:hypothetical protein